MVCDCHPKIEFWIKSSCNIAGSAELYIKTFAVFGGSALKLVFTGTLHVMQFI